LIVWSHRNYTFCSRFVRDNHVWYMMCGLSTCFYYAIETQWKRFGPSKSTPVMRTPRTPFGRDFVFYFYFFSTRSVFLFRYFCFSKTNCRSQRYLGNNVVNNTYSTAAARCASGQRTNYYYFFFQIFIAVKLSNYYL